MNSISLLDCTIREAPVKNLFFGNEFIENFISGLEQTNIDIIECGFLKNDSYLDGTTSFQRVEEIEVFLKNKKKNILYVALIDYGRYDLKYLSDYNGKSIDGIRICFKKGEGVDAIKLAYEIKNKGYKVFIQHVDTLGYDDNEIIEIIKAVNNLQPYSYAIVDTFGSMYTDDVRRLYSLISPYLDKKINFGYHAHNNMMLAGANSQEFIRLAHRDYNCSVDGSILGCGRGAGNAHTELMVEFLNKKFNTNYNLNNLLDLIDYSLPVLTSKGKWGYSIPYFLSGLHGAHVFNVNHLLRRHNIKSSDLRQIIDKLDDKHKKAYDYKLLEQIYVEYFNNQIDDKKSIEYLKDKFSHQKILVLASGNSVNTHKETIKEFIANYNPIIISINNKIAEYNADFIFYSSEKRYLSHSLNGTDSDYIIKTSNIKEKKYKHEIEINYLPLIKSGWINIDNATIILLRLLCQLKCENIYIAGFDGFDINNLVSNYYDNRLVTTIEKEDLLLMNKEIKEMLQDIKHDFSETNNIYFITPSYYLDSKMVFYEI